jgi:hypothetical protein
MSVAHEVKANGRAYNVVDDRVMSYRVVITGEVLDVLTGLPLNLPFTVTADRPDIHMKPTDGGLYAGSGFVEEIFRTPGPVSVHLTIAKDGYRGATVTVVIPAAPLFPVAAPPAAIRRIPVRLQGRITDDTGARNPIPGALVLVNTPNIFAARTALHFSHAPGVTARNRTLTAVPPTPILAADARAGDTRLFLNSVAGLAPGNLLRLGTAIDTEYVVLDVFGTFPNEIRLTGPLSRSFAAGGTVQRMTGGAFLPGPVLALSADPGDGLLILTGPLAGPDIEIVDAARTEYCGLGALAGADGYYALIGAGGARQIQVGASAFGFAPGKADLLIDYSNPVNVVNFRLV